MLKERKKENLVVCVDISSHAHFCLFYVSHSLSNRSTYVQKFKRERERLVSMLALSRKLALSQGKHKRERAKEDELGFQNERALCVRRRGWVFCSWMDLTASADHLERALWWASAYEMMESQAANAKWASARKREKKSELYLVWTAKWAVFRFDRIRSGVLRRTTASAVFRLSSHLFVVAFRRRFRHRCFAAGLVSEIDARLTSRCDAFRVRHSWAKAWAFMSEWEFG